MKTILGRFGLIIGLLIVAVAFIPQALMAKPAFWRVDGEAGTLFILGTFHRLPEGAGWFTPEIEALLRTSETLVLEVESNQASADYLAFLGKSPGIVIGRKPLNRVVGIKTYQGVVQRMEEFGLAAESFNRYRPWYTALLMARLGGEAAGFNYELGVETVLEGWAKDQNLAIISLETPHQQFLFLAGLSSKTEVEFLEQTLALSGNFAGNYNQLFQAWIKGDVVATEALVLDPLKTLPPMYQVLIFKRNQAWLEKLDHILQQGGQHFVAVGTGHLVGADSILKMLETAGYTITRQ